MNDNADSVVGREVDYHYCTNCGFRMSDIEFYSIIVDLPCPGRGAKPCGKPISMFHTAYKTRKENARFVRCSNCRKMVPWLDAADITTFEGTRTLCETCADKANERALIHHGVIAPKKDAQKGEKA